MQGVQPNWSSGHLLVVCSWVACSDTIELVVVVVVVVVAVDSRDIYDLKRVREGISQS